MHAVVGRAEARTQAARAFFFDSLQRARGSACGSGVTLEQRREIRLATCNAVDAAVEVAETEYRQAGQRLLTRVRRYSATFATRT